MMPRTILFALLCLLSIPVLGQPFLPARATMYNQGPDPYIGPQGAKYVEIWRYVPGARFEFGWDVKIEDREYDEAGRLLAWSRYQTVSGRLIWRKEFSYYPNGDRKTERTLRAMEGSNTLLTYQPATQAAEGSMAQMISNTAGKEVAVYKIEKDGRKVYVEFVGNPPADQYYIFDKNGKSEEVILANGRKTTYSYDQQGEMLTITQAGSGGGNATQYQNAYDSAGNLVAQTEVSAGKKLVRKFAYNDQGQLILKMDAAGNPIEYRSYFADGNISNMLITDPEGHPLEVIRYAYLNQKPIIE